MKKKVVPKLRQEVKVKVDIVTSDDIKICYIGKFQDFTARYIIKWLSFLSIHKNFDWSKLKAFAEFRAPCVQIMKFWC